MVERPIKKSERLEKANSDASDSPAQPSGLNQEKSGSRPERRKDGKGKGKGARREEEPRQAVNPALMRGPKPTKAKPEEPPVEVEAEVETDAATATDEAVETAADPSAEAGTETPAEATVNA